MRHLFIINPKAGKHMDVEAVSGQIRDLMAARTDPWEIYVTTGPADAERKAREFGEQNPEAARVYALGGDGTINEVVNGIAGLEHVAMAFCPMGSGNDFVKLFAKGRELFRDLKNLIDAPDRPLDLIECNGRYSINICSLGLDARVGLGMVKYKNWPLVTGTGAYMFSLIDCVIHGIHRPYELELDGKRMDGNYTLICVANGRWYGGSFNPTPDSVPDDGLLDIVIAKAVSRLKVAQLVLKYAKGRGSEFPKIIQMTRGRELKIKCDRMSMAQVDGERIDADTFTIRLSEYKLRLVIPDGASW